MQTAKYRCELIIIQRCSHRRCTGPSLPSTVYWPFLVAFATALRVLALPYHRRCTGPSLSPSLQHYVYWPFLTIDGVLALPCRLRYSTTCTGPSLPSTVYWPFLVAFATALRVAFEVSGRCFWFTKKKRMHAM